MTSNRGKAFPLTDGQLATRLACHPQVAARQLHYLIKAGVLLEEQQGRTREKDQPRVYSTYNWALSGAAGSQRP